MIVAVAGRIGAGKSHLSDALAEKLGAARTSFGAAVRMVALERGLPTHREALQGLGEQLIADEGWERFTERVLPNNGGPVVIDGVRHVAAVQALGDLSRRRVLLVFVDASRDRRAARVAARDAAGPEVFEAAERHPNEAEVEQVRELADVVVNNDTDDSTGLADQLATVVDLVRRRSATPGDA